MHNRLLMLGAALAGCAAPSSSGSARLAALADPHVAAPAPARWQRLVLAIDWPQKPAARGLQIFDPTYVTAAAIQVVGPGAATVSATASLGNGESGALTLVVPEASNLVFSVIGIGVGGTPVAYAQIGGVASVPADKHVRIGWDTTPAARVFLELQASGSAMASLLDRAAVQAFCNRVVYGTADGATASVFVTHPALVNARALASAILARGGLPESATGFDVAPARISGTVSGLILGQTATVSADDPSSEPVSTDVSGKFTITGVLPGSPTVLSAFNPYFAATSSIVQTLAANQTVTANLALGGNFLLREPAFPSANGECGLNGYQVARFTQSPVRILVIQPTGTRATSFGFANSDVQAIDEAVETMGAEMGDLLSFEVSLIRDDDANLATQIRRSDVFVSYLKQFDIGGCGAGVAAGCAHYYPGNDGYNYCNSLTGTKLVGRSYQVGVRLSTADPDGYPRSVRWRSATALHELTHALGLGHSGDVLDVMLSTSLDRLPTTYSATDLRTLRLHYSLPTNFTRDHSLFDLVPVAQNPGTFSYNPGEPE